MKNSIFIATFFISAFAHADLFTCVVPKATEPLNWPDSFIKIETIQDGGYDRINTIFHVRQIPQSDGTFLESPELVYNWNHRFYEIGFCSLNENAILNELTIFKIHSECAVKGNDEDLVFKAAMSTYDKGIIELDYFPKDSDVVRRRISTEPCTLVQSLPRI